MRSLNRLAKLLATVGLLLSSSAWVQALGPHELLVLVNEKSLRSKEVANAFARQRNVPPENIVYLDLPDSVLEPAAAVSPADFTRTIWEPANAAVQQRGIGDHILAWIYSVDFPIRVTTDPAMSIQGLTFMRNRVPAAEMIQKGLYQSPLFAGPDSADHPGAPAHSLESFSARLQTEMPLPSMMLGFAGSRGSDVESVLRVLRRGLLADHTSPMGDVFFVVSENVRSKCRAWQYPGAQQELEKLRVVSRITPDFPDPASKVMGLMCGQDWIDAGVIKNALPGCVAEHLTSFSAVFDYYDQSKTAEWLNGGAAASAGVVTEPMSIWTKFPHARFFVHYATGCTILESFYQAIRCPLQILILGEPLASPWSPGLTMVLVQLDEGPVTSDASFHAQLFPADPSTAPDYLYLLDGRSLNAASKPDVKIRTDHLADGYHELRSIAYLQGAVRHQVSATAGFTVNRKGRNVELEGVSPAKEIDLFHPVAVRLRASGEPERVGVMCGAVEIASAAAGEGGSSEISMDPLKLGPGPSKIQAFAKYADGDYVRGEPVSLKVVRRDQPPVINHVNASTNQEGRIVLAAEVSDAENDPVDVQWFQPLLTAKAVSGEVDATGPSMRMVPPTNGFGIAVFPSSFSDAREMRSDVRFVGHAPRYRDQYAGLAFHYRDSANFGFFGFFGDGSAWALGTCRDGKMVWSEARGAVILPDTDYALSVRKTSENVLECRVNDDLLISAPDEHSGLGNLGLMAAAAPAGFGLPAIFPPAPASAFDEDGRTLSVSPESAIGQILFIHASDGHRSSRKTVTLPATK